MSAHGETSPDTGNRVTMAQVYRTVDDLGKNIGESFKTVEAHFDGVKIRLDLLAPLPEKVAQLETRITLLEDAGSDRDRNISRFLSIAALVVAILALLFT